MPMPMAQMPSTPASRAIPCAHATTNSAWNSSRRALAKRMPWAKKFLVASNLMPHNAKVKTYLGDMAQVIALRPDALIMADPGLISMVRETWPEQTVHLSVQANTVNYATVKF